MIFTGIHYHGSRQYKKQQFKIGEGAHGRYVFVSKNGRTDDNSRKGLEDESTEIVVRMGRILLSSLGLMIESRAAKILPQL